MLVDMCVKTSKILQQTKCSGLLTTAEQQGEVHLKWYCIILRCCVIKMIFHATVKLDILFMIVFLSLSSFFSQ